MLEVIRFLFMEGVFSSGEWAMLLVTVVIVVVVVVVLWVVVAGWEKRHDNLSHVPRPTVQLQEPKQ